MTDQLDHYPYRIRIDRISKHFTESSIIQSSLVLKFISK
jgi:hypothetical protein